MLITQGTVATFDADSRSGSVLLDDGLQVSFRSAAFARSGLRSLRLGQRVRLEIDDSDDRQIVRGLTVVTLPLRD